MEERPLNDDEYPEDLTEMPPRPPRELDPISAAVGTGAYVYRHTVDDCVERFVGTVARFPERFDRFYFQTDNGPLLVDVLEDATEEQLHRDTVRKRVEFKQAWCAEHGRRYLVVGESDAQDVGKVRQLLATLDGPSSEAASEPRVSQPARTATARKRGAIQRPKAAA